MKRCMGWVIAQVAESWKISGHIFILCYLLTGTDMNLPVIEGRWTWHEYAKGNLKMQFEIKKKADWLVVKLFLIKHRLTLHNEHYIMRHLIEIILLTVTELHNRPIHSCVSYFCSSRKDELEGEVFEMLLTFTDFLAFKEMFLDYRAVSGIFPMSVVPVSFTEILQQAQWEGFTGSSSNHLYLVWRQKKVVQLTSAQASQWPRCP